MPFKTIHVSGEQPRPRGRRSWFVGASIGLTLLLGLVTTILINLHMSASAKSFSSIPGSVPAVVVHSKNVSAVSGDQTLSLAISLKLRNKEALQGLLQDAKDKKSVNYGRHLSASQVQNSFSPTQQSYDAVVSYLQSQGFKIDHTYNHRLLISFSGTASQAESAFHVQLNNYVDAKGRQYYANANDPTLPQELAGVVESIVGLDNYAKLTYQSPVNNTAPTKNSSVTASAIGSNGCPLPYNPSVDSYPYLLPSQFATAYNYDGLYAKGYKGEGQSVALFEMSDYAASDVQTFINCFDKGTPTNILNIRTSVDAPGYSGAFEVELDADIVLGMAPNLNQLRIYEAANDNNNVANYLGEWAQIIADNVPVVSTGWRLCEANQGTSIMDTENNLFMTAAAQGQTIVAASGFFGSSDCYDRYNPGSPPLPPAVDDPASQPYVTGIGATVLNVNSDNSYANETTYNDVNGASGGGISSYWPHPSWQVAPGTDSSLNRQVPDVSLYGARYQGYLIYCSVMQSNCYPGYWGVVGDPSAASAMWASFIALANEQSVKNGGYNLGFINPYLYQIASGSNYNNDFHDVTTGSNDWDGIQGGKYPATAGYDMATGLGSLNAGNLANDLVALANAGKSARQAPTSKTWYFAEGSVGGSSAFQEFITLQNPSTTTASLVNVTYLFTNMPSRVKSYTVNPSSRFTVNVNADLALPQSTQYAISAIVQVTSGPGIVAERPMYFNYRSIISSGTDVLGASNPGTSYYFPLADTNQNNSDLAWTYISILNPSKTNTANVTLTYYDGSCGAVSNPCKTQQIQVGALMRGTGTPSAVGLLKKVAVKVTSDQPIVVERPMYVKTTITTAGGTTTGAASQVGAVTPGTTWDFAQGNTGSKYQQYYVVANYGATPANVTVKLTYADATAPTSFSVPVAPYTQYTVDVNSKNAGKPAIFGAEITSDQPVVVDREQFFHYGSANQSGLTDVIGAPTAQGVYSFAEGYVSSSFSEYMSVLNPTDTDETVVITYFGDNRVFQQQFVVKAHKVILVNVGDTILPFGSGVNSSTVQAMKNGTIVAERVMYFGYHDKNGGTDTVGYTGN